MQARDQLATLPTSMPATGPLVAGLLGRPAIFHVTTREISLVYPCGEAAKISERLATGGWKPGGGRRMKGDEKMHTAACDEAAVPAVDGDSLVQQPSAGRRAQQDDKPRADHLEQSNDMLTAVVDVLGPHDPGCRAIRNDVREVDGEIGQASQGDGLSQPPSGRADERFARLDFLPAWGLANEDNISARIAVADDEAAAGRAPAADVTCGDGPDRYRDLCSTSTS